MKVFVSYRRGDTAAIAGRLYDRLASHFDRESVFMDIDTIPLGVDFRKQLNDAVQQCEVLLALIGDRWFEADEHGNRRLDDPSDYVRIEIEAALARDISVIPVLIGRSLLPREAELPSSLRDLIYRNALQLDPGQDFEAHVNRLIRGIERFRAKATNESLANRQATRTPLPSQSADPSTRVVKVSQKQEEVIRIRIEIRHTGTVYEAEVPLDIRVDQLLQDFVDQLRLPKKFENGWPVPYKLYSATRKVLLSNEQTVRENGVQDMETLLFHTEMLAG